MSDNVRLCRALARALSERGVVCSDAAKSKARDETEKQMVYLTVGLTCAEIAMALCAAADALEADELARLDKSGRRRGSAASWMRGRAMPNRDVRYPYAACHSGPDVLVIGPANERVCEIPVSLAPWQASVRSVRERIAVASVIARLLNEESERCRRGAEAVRVEDMRE
jgi:hypothetical protein